MPFPFLAAGVAIMAAGQLMAASSASSAQRKQAAQYRLAAVRARLKAEDDARMIQRHGEKFQANQAVGFAKSGVTLSSGSPLATLMDTAINVERNAMKTRLTGEWAAQGLDSGASVYDKMATNSMWAGFAGAAGTFLSAAGSAQGDYSPSKAMTTTSSGSMTPASGGYTHTWGGGGYKT